MELNPRDGRHWPFIGSVVDYLEPTQAARPSPAVPDNIALPFPFSSHRVGEVPRAGPYAAFLGGAYNPVWTEFRGKATRPHRQDAPAAETRHRRAVHGHHARRPFRVAGAADAVADLTLDRLDPRRSLLEQFDQGRRDLDASDAGRSLDRYRDMAYDLIHSDKVRNALDLSREPAACANPTA